jgi:hypothetical protein
VPLAETASRGPEIARAVEKSAKRDRALDRARVREMKARILNGLITLLQRSVDVRATWKYEAAQCHSATKARCRRIEIPQS